MLFTNHFLLQFVNGFALISPTAKLNFKKTENFHTCIKEKYIYFVWVHFVFPEKHYAELINLTFSYKLDLYSRATTLTIKKPYMLWEYFVGLDYEQSHNSL